MKIINIDAPVDLASKVEYLSIPEFILSVLRSLEREFYYAHFVYRAFPPSSRYKHHSIPIWKFEYEGYENIATLAHTIPIYLRHSKPEKKDDNSIIDLLGAYYSNRHGDTPYIELYLKGIDDATNGNDEHFKWLFVKVLIHELAHAALDIFNWERHDGSVEKVSYHTEFGRWREESMANAITLHIIKMTRKRDFYNYAKQFVLSQPAEYALGALMGDVRYWDFRSVFDSKQEGVDSTLQQIWLDYVKGNPKKKGLKMWNDLLSSEYVYVFNKKYYTSAEELVYDIVGKVLSDYESHNGVKMPFSTFSSLFPYIKTGAEMSYEPTHKVKDDSRYKYRIELQDGDYSLYYSWNHDSLNKFIANVNIDLTEYSNWR
jgi:hypothetical protein